MIDNDEAIKRAVKSFYDGNRFDEYEKISGKKTKYDQEFFDGFEEELRGSKVSPKKSKEIVSEEVEE